MTNALQIPCGKQNLKPIRSFVQKALNNSGMSEEDINLMVLAVDEVCMNLIIHSHQCNEKDTLEIRVLESDKRYIFEIYDYAPDDFNLANYETPDMNQIIREKRKGGMGLILVKKIVDDIQVEKHQNHSVCRLFKSIASPNR